MLKPLLRAASRRMLGHAGAAVDVGVVRIVQRLSKPSARSAQPPDERRAWLDAVAARYAAIDPAAFYAPPPPPRDVRERFVREVAAPDRGTGPSIGGVSDVWWPSGWEPKCTDERARYLRWEENRTVHVRLFRHPRPMPAIVCIHGYRTGSFAFEERAWAAEWLYRRGLDVALFTLPFHALRAAGSRRTPLFPSADVPRTNEAFGQAMWDLRGLMTWLRANGAPHVGVAGMSLGGYATALAATVDSTLDFAVPFIPVADMTDVVVEHERLRGTVVPPFLIEAGKRAMSIVRPLARAPLIAGDRVLVIGAESDRIAPRRHAELLAEHFDAELVLFAGSHLLQFGRRDGFGALAKFLARRGLVAARGNEGALG